MSKGKVRYFNDLKGWGFIACDDHDETAYVHYTAIEMDGYRTLTSGQAVLLELAQTDNGLQATKVVPC